MKTPKLKSFFIYIFKVDLGYFTVTQLYSDKNTTSMLIYYKYKIKYALK